MSRPANTKHARALARSLLERSLPGSKARVREHSRRAESIAEVIYRRWHVGIFQWQVKHLRWVLQHVCADLSPGRLYRFWLTVRILVCALGEEDSWLPQLRGPWVRPTGDGSPVDPRSGGRPTRLPVNINN